MQPIKRIINLDNASATKVAATQTVLINGSLVLTAAASAIDSSGTARILLITTTEDDSAGNLTFIGTNADGDTITEVVTMPSSSTAVTTKAYASVSSIVTSIAITSNISIGTVASTLTAVDRMYSLDFYDRIPLQVAVSVTGTINFTVQETFDRIIDGSTTKDLANKFKPTALTSKTASTVAQLDVGATGVQIVINSYSSGATLVAEFISPANVGRG